MALFIPQLTTPELSLCVPYSHHLALSMSHLIRTVKTLMHQPVFATIVRVPLTVWTDTLLHYYSYY